MQQYQSYLPNIQTMNPYPPNYNSQIQANNAYLDRMNQLQQYQQNLQQPVQQSQNQPQGIIGRVVNDFSEITANDVPMSGQAAFFPKADGSELQVRSWASNGTIQTVVYKPIQTENPQEGSNIPQMDFNALNEDVRALREDIKDMRRLIEKSTNGTATKTTRGKKTEVSADE